MKISKTQFKAILVYARLILPAIMLLLSVFNVFDDMIDSLGRGYIYTQATNYLEKSEAASKNTFILLSIAKSGIAILESSQAGISFIVDADVQLGKAFESLKHLVDSAWKLSLGGLSLQFVTKILLSESDAIVPTLMLTFSVLWLLHAILKHWGCSHSVVSDRVLRAMGVGIFVIVFAFPLAIYGTSFFSKQVTAEVSDQVRKGLEEHNKLFSNKIDPDNLKDSARDALELFRSKIKDIHQHVELMHTYVYQYAATLFLEIIAIPMLLLWILYLGARLVAKGRLNLHAHSGQHVGVVKTET
jgi:hypothetical protein